MTAPMRPCLSCGNYDTHPRHVHVNGMGVEELRHLDCCLNSGCPDGSCETQLRSAKGIKGDELRTHLEGLTDA